MPKLAVIGHPVSHSRSPAMHNAALRELGLGDEWEYRAIDVGEAEFGDRVKALASEGYAGANVTVPHKIAALEIADEASSAAREIGAANTLCFREGRILAENTDGDGLLDALPSSPAGACTLVMGAGGSARAVVWALVRAGAEVQVWNRTESKARALAHELGANLAVVDHETAATNSGSFELFVNCTTVGMTEASTGVDTAHDTVSPLKALPVAADALVRGKTVVDLVYGTHETQLISTARRGGADVVDGLEVLVRQGARSLRLWTGLEPPIDVMRREARGASRI
ncbi:shikimate dehydrogenase [soil metagenome]